MSRHFAGLCLGLKCVFNVKGLYVFLSNNVCVWGKQTVLEWHLKVYWLCSWVAGWCKCLTTWEQMCILNITIFLWSRYDVITLTARQIFGQILSWTESLGDTVLIFILVIPQCEWWCMTVVVFVGADVGGVVLAENDNWPTPDAEYTPHSDLLSAVWPTLRHHNYKWAVLRVESDNSIYYKRPSELQLTDLCYHPQKLKCGHTSKIKIWEINIPSNEIIAV